MIEYGYGSLRMVLLDIPLALVDYGDTMWVVIIKTCMDRNKYKQVNKIHLYKERINLWIGKVII